MSCQIRLVATIADIEAIRRCLFPTDDKRGSDNWLQQCHISISPIGDLIALARERRLVILASRWDSTSSSSQFHITFSGMIHEVDNVKAVLCLPIVGQTKSSHVSDFRTDHKLCFIFFHQLNVGNFMKALVPDNQAEKLSAIDCKCVKMGDTYNKKNVEKLSLSSNCELYRGLDNLQFRMHRVTPDWSCIMLGFESGYIRIYMETSEILYEEQFHNECITSIKCQSQHNPRPDISLDLHSEEIFIQYQSNVCVIAGNQLFPLLRNYRAQLARVQAHSELLEMVQTAINVRKWGFQDQSIINDIAVVGLAISNAFDHLLTASTCGGFDSKVRSMPPNSTLVLGAGSKPFLGFHYAIEGGSQPVLSDVAKAVAYKLKSALPSWLTGSHPQIEKRPAVALQPADQMGCRFGLCDLHRTANSIILSPSHKLAAISDSLGRVILINTDKGVALRVFKGYRDAQCSFIQVPDERRSKHKIGNKVALFLVIYAPKKGTIEIFTTQQCAKIATFSALKHSRLIYINYGLMGFGQPSKSKYICQFTTIFIDNDGRMKEIMIPFHFALSEKNNKRARDIHLYKKIRELIKCGNCDNDTLLTEAYKTTKELKTVEIKSQFIEFLSTSKNLPVEILLKCAQYFVDNLIEEDDKEVINVLKVKVSNIVTILNFYLFILNTSNPCNQNENSVNSEEMMTSTILKLDGREMGNLKKLLDLNAINDNKKPNELKVTFSDNESYSISEFLSVFELSDDSGIKLLPNQDETVLYKVSETLFHEYIVQGKNYEHFQEEVAKSRIFTKDLFFLLINYWVNRPLSVHSNLEAEMDNLASLLYILVRTSEDLYFKDNDTIEEFWSEIRDILADSNRPFPALTAAMLCKYVAYKIEREKDMDQSSSTLDDEDIEIWSEENIEWTLLIGKLEDVSLLNILITNKPKVSENCPLPRLQHDKINVSLKYILERKGSVSELVARWLTMSGIDPEFLIINDKINKLQTENNPKPISTSNEDEEMDVSVSEEKISFVRSNTVFQHFNMIRTQWPYSLEAGMILANMSWEYALEWKKNIQNLDCLEACISCLKQIPNFHVRLGLFNLVWKTHLKLLFENTTKLLNKVGKVPKERLCQQDTGLSDLQISKFITICTDFLDTFSDIVQEMYNVPKAALNFEPLWENGGQPLAELAIQQTSINYDLLLLHYQLSLVFLMLSTFSLKAVKPVNNLFEFEVVNVLFYDFQEKPEIDFNRTDSKLTIARIQFLNKVISSSVESITVKNDEVYATDHVYWMSKCRLLGMIWNLDVDVLKINQVVQLFTHGYNVIAHDLCSAVRDKNKLGIELLAIAGKRMSKYVAGSSNLGTHLAALTPTVTRYMETLNGDWCAESSLKDIIDVTTLSISCLDDSQPEYKLALLLLEACTTLRDLGE